MQNTINQRIKDLIKELSMTSRGFSSAIDVPDATTRNYIDGRSKPSAEYLEKIIRTYAHVNPQWLLSGIGPILLSDAEEPMALYQKNSGGNNIGQNTGSGQVTQTHSAGTTGQAAVDDCALKLEAANNTIALLQQQIKDKERIIQLLERHSMPPN